MRAYALTGLWVMQEQQPHSQPQSSARTEAS
jgi:hypothetical protein